MLEAIADGETNRETLAALADRGLRATQEQLQDALSVCQELNPAYRRLIKMMLGEVASIDKRIDQLNQEMANLLRPHEDQVKRLAEVPGLGVDSAQQIKAAKTVLRSNIETNTPRGPVASAAYHCQRRIAHL